MELRFSTAFFSLSLQNIPVTVPYYGHAPELDSDDLDKPPQNNMSSLTNFVQVMLFLFLAELFVVVCPRL